MKKAMATLIIVLSFFWALNVWAQAPSSLAGFELGADKDKYTQKLDLDRVNPAPDEVFLEEIPLLTHAIPGVRIGYLYFGRCEKPGQLIRIKLKFDDNTKGFFDQMLDLYSKAWGNPASYRGDPFQNHVSWKWSFKRQDGERVSLVLSYSRDPQDRFGNMVKMSLRNAWNQEKDCWDQKHPYKESGGGSKAGGRTDLLNLVPK